MNPINFPEANVIFGEGQSQYRPLPAFRDEDGQVVSCWELGWRDRLKLLFTGRLWLSQLTFNNPLQPQLPSVNYPFERTPKGV